MIPKLKDLLKRSGFIVGVARAIRAGRVDIKKLHGYATRNSKIQTYLRNSRLKKLQLGASHSLIPGWLNTDLLSTSREVVYLDATRPFPFEDDVFDYVYSEHMIEHIGHQSAVSMLRECFRVLKPGGKIRISTPDLKVYTALHSKEKTASQNHYVDWMSQKLVAEGFVPEVDYCKDVFIINNAFRSWGHQFLYDRETLRVTLSRVGFKDLEFYQPCVSDDENLRGIESHGSVMGCEAINQFEAFAIEGLVLNPKLSS